MQTAEVVQQMYEAFGRGDVPGILEHLAEDVEWEYGLVSTKVPWLQRLRGRADVPRFFEALQRLEFNRFEPHTILASEDVVVVLVNLDATVKSTGKLIQEEDEVHIWWF